MKLHFVVIAATVFALFGGAVTHDFVWDDNVITVGNKVYEDFDLGGIFFSLANGLEYLPVRDVSYALDYLIWGWNPAGFHFTNVVLYLLNALALYVMTLEITSLLFRDRTEQLLKGVAFLATMLFVVHPVHSEVVNFISGGRNQLLAGMFFFLSCFFYLKFISTETGGSKYYTVTLLCFLLSVFSKATAIIQPLVLLLFVAFSSKDLRIRKALALIPFFVIAGAVFFLFRAVAVSSGMVNEDQVIVFGSRGYSSRFAIAAQIPFFYAKQLLIPEGLSVMYRAGFSRTISDPVVILSFAVLIAIFVIGFVVRRRHPEVLLSLLWFMIALGPVLNLFLTTPVVADRYVYIASYAFVFLLAAVFLHGIREGLRRRALILIVPAIIVLSIICYERNGAWKSDKTLWESTLEVSPRAVDAYSKLVTIYMSEGDQNRAATMLEKLEELNPSSGKREYLNGVRRAREGDLSGAIISFEKVASSDNNNIDAHYILGTIYEKTGEHEKAIENYMGALSSGKIDPEGIKDLARQRLEALRDGLKPKLDALRKEVIEKPSDLNKRVRLAMALEKVGMYDEALEGYNELIRLGGDNWGVYYNIANINHKMGRLEEAASYYEKSLLFNKNNPRAYNDLGIVYRTLKMFDEAIGAFERAIRIDRNYGFAYFNLAVTYFQLGDRDNALRYFGNIEQSFPALKDRAHDYVSQLQEY
jgi:tetratricopeptide (TPR) repeat protein